jgi:hypothetical protein
LSAAGLEEDEKLLFSRAELKNNCDRGIERERVWPLKPEFLTNI